jgi:hypothetical protein
MAVTLEKKNIKYKMVDGHLLGDHVQCALGPAVQGVVSQGRLRSLHKETTTLRNSFTCLPYSFSMTITRDSKKAGKKDD